MASMGLALRAIAPLLHLPRFAGTWLRLRPTPRPAVRLIHATVDLAPEPPARSTPASRVLSSARGSPGAVRAARPVRVLLRPREGACRVALSGRMADVCAELDRLALQ